ncbi:hypothetical protein ORI98_02560 [Shewanella sp. ULN5]|uniref:hypothetical protein n=1 Tax=Shewanella sp. ULN5 TaxID=2994678 RepID=UPI00273EAB73|nr:hypothetical protein [Shewanella sp. ULN5]MDP5145322.1 hypothetical protein [Shewanella sp. ULN5]
MNDAPFNKLLSALEISRIKIVIGSFISVGLVEALSDYLIYIQVILPMLPEVQAVPVFWWLVLFSPLIAVCIVIGGLSKSVKGIVPLAISASISMHLYNQIAAILNLPGHAKSWAYEAPLKFWSIGLGLQAMFCFLLMLIGYAIVTYYVHRKVST